MPALLAVHETDPKKDIMKRVGKQLQAMDIFGNNILVATYVRPKMARHGKLVLELADTTRKEDEYQGKVGLVLKLGPMAYVDDETTQFHGQNVKVGDWVVYRPADGWSLELPDGQVKCRMLIEASIRMRIPSPDAVW